MKPQEPTGYELSKDWFNFCFDNPELINTNHTALYFFILEHRNRMGGAAKFGLPRRMSMDAIGMKCNRAYSKALADLVQWGFIAVVQESKNQYSSTIISVTKSKNKASGALTAATNKHAKKAVETDECRCDADAENASALHGQQHEHRTGTAPIINTNNLIIEEQPEPEKKVFKKPQFEEVEAYCKERANQIDPAAFCDFYQSKGWKVGNTPMKDWKSAVRNWERNGYGKKPNKQTNGATPKQDKSLTRIDLQ